jgi:hypothetical protein
LAISIYNIICHFTTEVSQPHFSSSKLKSALTQGVPDLYNHYLNLPNNSVFSKWVIPFTWDWFIVFSDEFMEVLGATPESILRLEIVLSFPLEVVYMGSRTHIKSVLYK